MYSHLQERYSTRPPVNVGTLARMRAEGEKIACLTAYDASFAALLDEASVDVVLVGDSLGMVIQGHGTTVPVTLSDVIYHCKAVSRGLYRPFLMADMPFMTYASREQALDNAVRLMQEGGAKMVKLEGGAGQVEIVEFLSGHDIPVCAHLGLTPQTVHALGGYRVQGRTGAAADVLKQQAHALEDAGASMLVLEMVPADVSADLTQALQHCATIGIGAGKDTAGQVLVLHDMLGVSLGKMPKFVRNFMADGGSIRGAMEAYVAAVKDGSFPVNALHAW